MKEHAAPNLLIRRLLLSLLIMGTVSLTVFALASDLKTVLLLFASVSPAWLTLIAVCVLFNYALRFLKWQFFLWLINVSVPLKTSLWVFFSAFTMVLSPAKLGELVKAYLLKARLGIPVSKTAPVILAERVTDLAGLLILCSIGFARFSFGGRTIVAVAILIIAGIAMFTRQIFWEKLHSLIAKFPRLVRLQKPVELIRESTGNLLSFKSLVVTVPLSAVSWAGEGFALFYIFAAMGQELPELVYVSIFAHAFSSIAGALSFLPGGLLVAEGSMTAFLLSASIEKSVALSATFFIRAVTLWFAVVLGTLVFLAGHEKNDWQAIRSEKQVEPAAAKI